MTTTIGVQAAAAVPLLPLIVAALSACVSSPDIGMHLAADVRISGDAAVVGAAVFEVPGNLDVDCESYARRGLHDGRRCLQVNFVPVDLDERAPLRQLAVAITGRPGTGDSCTSRTSDCSTTPG